MFLVPYRDDNPSHSFPFLTLILIAINVVVFFRTTVADTLANMVTLLGFTPEALLVRPYVVFTSLFLHANLLHLVGNMWFLWLFGDNVEDRFGRLPFLTLYLLSGVAGSFANTLFSLHNVNMPIIGASGAVAGVMGSYLIRFPTARVRCVFFIIFYPIFFRMFAFWFIGMWMLVEFIAAYLSPADYVAHWAHIGGFILGFAWTWGRRDRPYSRRSFWW